MSDLISRKKVIDILEKEKSLRCGYDADIAIFSIEKGIRELPTSRMNEAFEKIISQIRELANYNGDAYLDSADVIEIVQDVAEKYSYPSEWFNSGLLKRIADYFSSVYEGDDKTAPKMELSVYELREIASLHIEKCKLQAEINKSKDDNGGWIACSGCKECHHKECEHYGEV